jgi:hypothetical protein
VTNGIAFNRMADRLRDLDVPTKYGGGALRAQGICHGADGIGAVSIKRGNNGSLVVWCHACEDNKGFLEAIGWTLADLNDEPLTERRDRPADDLWVPCGKHGHKRVAQYLYLNEQRAVEHGVTRCDHKCFAQWRPDDTTRSGRRWSLNDQQGNRLVRALPYRLPELLEARQADRVVFVAEGEKDVHALVDHGLVATCNAGGAGKWTTEHARFLKGADVTIVADRDEPGQKHAVAVVETLRDVARSVYVVQAKSGKDAADHFAAGHKDHEFVQVWAPVPYPGDPAVTK